jgi:hypothetical protein
MIIACMLNTDCFTCRPRQLVANGSTFDNNEAEGRAPTRSLGVWELELL